MLGVLAIVVAATLGAPPAAGATPAPARLASACPPVTLKLPARTGSGKLVASRVTIRRRHVTCAKARRMIAAYVRRVRRGDCAGHGSRCILSMGARWSCSALSPTETEMAGGATMGCHRSSRTGFVIVPAGPAQTGEREFYVGGAPGMSCYIDAPRMACQYHSAAGEQKATLSRHGGLRACRWVGGAGGECGLGNPGEGTPTYKAGRVVAFAGYRCEIVAAGVRCVVAASGKGFEMTPDGVAAVGGAILVPELPQAQEVLSSDHLVWCGVDTDVNALTCSTADFSHVGDVDGYGTIAICNDGSLACTHEFHASAPVIAPGAQAELSGYRCTAAADGDGIACVEPRTGRGVMVTSGAASAIG